MALKKMPRSAVFYLLMNWHTQKRWNPVIWPARAC